MPPPEKNPEIFLLDPWFSTRSALAPQGTFGNVRRHFLVVTTQEDVTGIQWVEAREAAEPPTEHGTDRTAPTTKTSLAQGVDSPEVERPCSTCMYYY